MLLEIQNKIEQRLPAYIRNLDASYSLSKLSPSLFKAIREFVLRKGKRARPILFVLGYLGFSKKVAPNLYTSALSLELLHDFMLVHDDIIDKSALRRGKPSMHSLLNKYLDRYRNIKFNGEDLAIIAGDVMYALGIRAFLSIKEDAARKERALKKLIETALYTASGEFIEILYGMKGIEDVGREDVYKVYDLKTAHYTFASPLSMGAILAGAKEKEIAILLKYGMYLGRAFQIKDDILGMFADEKETGKSVLTDLQEAKKTVLIWYAYHHCGFKDRKRIKEILSKKQIIASDLLDMRRIIVSSGALDYARKEVSTLVRKAQALLEYSRMRAGYKKSLAAYSQELLNL